MKQENGPSPKEINEILTNDKKRSLKFDVPPFSFTGLAGFEPAICSLGDCRPIQARLQAQIRNNCERSILGLFLKVDSHTF
jgi:hypothetical protein